MKTPTERSDKEAGVLQSRPGRFGEKKNLLSMLGTESRIIQPAAQSLNRQTKYPYIEVNKHDVAVQAHIFQVRHCMQFSGENRISSEFITV